MTGAPIDLLYRLTQRDQAFPHWGPNFGYITILGSAIAINTTRDQWDAALALPLGTVLFLTNLVLIANPGGALTAGPIDISLRNRETDNLLSILAISDGAPVAENLRINSPMDCAILLDRFYLQATGNFSAATSANRIEFSWAGYIVPAGELGFV